MISRPDKYRVINNPYPVPSSLSAYSGESASSGARICIIASGKGGVGKTWFSIALSHALAQRGKKILLFDGDLGLANIDVQLGVMPHKDLGTVIARQCSLDEAVTRCENGAFDMIAGRSGCGLLASLSLQRLALLQEEIRFLARRYDVVLMDLGAGVGGTVRALSALASECIVMTTEEPTSLTDAYAFIKLMTQLSCGVPLYVVVNQAESQRTAERTYGILKKVCEKFLGVLPISLGSVQRDARVRESIHSQAMILSRYPNSEAAQDIQSIAEGLVKIRKREIQKC